MHHKGVAMFAAKSLVNDALKKKERFDQRVRKRANKTQTS